MSGIPDTDAVWSVTELVAGAKVAIEAALGPCWVRGEVAEWKSYQSGHWYFTLRDAGAQVRCVMWKAVAQKHKPPADGGEVFALVSPGIYEARGEFRLTVNRILATADLGAAQQLFERTKAALLADGLLDAGRKRPLPPMPMRVAVVTSLDGAALRDIISVARGRWPLATLQVIGVRVQGETAPAEIATALALVNRLEAIDLCIVGRGGGAKDDLSAFNDEKVCRALAAVNVPTISAVGHETDITLADLVADVRAATPSNAVELALPDQRAIGLRVDQMGARLARALERRSLVARERAERAGDRMQAALERRVVALRNRLDRAGAQLDALSPLRVLDRGYAVPRDATGHVLRRRADFTPGVPFTLRVSDGDVAARAEAS